MAGEQRKGPKRFSRRELERFGVRPLNFVTCEMECMKCGGRWTTTAGPQGNLPRYYWRCPQGCNAS